MPKAHKLLVFDNNNYRIYCGLDSYSRSSAHTHLNTGIICLPYSQSSNGFIWLIYAVCCIAYAISFCLEVEFRTILPNYMSGVFGDKVRIRRCDTPVGLIRGRLLGARMATAKVLASMDAHMEVQNRWYLNKVHWHQGH